MHEKHESQSPDCRARSGMVVRDRRRGRAFAIRAVQRIGGEWTPRVFPLAWRHLLARHDRHVTLYRALVRFGHDHVKRYVGDVRDRSFFELVERDGR